VNLGFDSASLSAVRAAARDQACRAGFSDSRVADVVLAVHELAANAVSHGAGSGCLRIWKLADVLHCQVDDGDPPASGNPAEPRAGRQDGEVARAGGAFRPAATSSWPAIPGHGLWVVRQAADQMLVVAGPHGTRAAVAFKLPSDRI
jgi:anti-sigma regulatory factor (Ser/Thr protein kinase)